MRETSFNWRTSEGKALFVREWQTKEEIKGIICIIHGLGEHSGRYQHVAHRLTEMGLLVMATDLEGHGRSEGKKGHINSYLSFYHQINLLLEKAAKEHPMIPLFLYGHSLGGNIILNYCLIHPRDLHGVIITSPWLKLAFNPPPIKLFLGRIMNSLWPSFSQNNAIDPKNLSHDQEIRRSYQKDPLIHNRISARLFWSAYERGLWALERADSFKNPLLLLHGTSDSLTSWEASRLFSMKAPYCTFKAYEGLYHELHNEIEKEEVLETIRDWIEKRLKKDG